MNNQDVFYLLDVDRTIWLVEGNKRTRLSSHNPAVAMAHPHKNCTPCNSSRDAHLVEFVEACLEAKTQSYQVLYERLRAKGFNITKTDEPKA